MSTLSPRTGLTVLADSDFVNSALIDSNASRLDLITSVQQCTSSTRPSAPFEGQHIFETDTKNFRRYDATSAAWYLLGSGPSGSAAQGLVNSFSNTSAATFAGSGIGSSGTQVVSLLDYNFPVLANRMYKIIEQGWFSLTGTYSNTVSNNWAEFYSAYNMGSQPALSSTSSLHYIKKYYSSLKFGAKVPYYKNMEYVSSGAGTLYVRSLFRGFCFSSQNFGKPADSVGSYAWVYDMGPSGSSY